MDKRTNRQVVKLKSTLWPIGKEIISVHYNRTEILFRQFNCTVSRHLQHIKKHVLVTIKQFSFQKQIQS